MQHSSFEPLSGISRPPLLSDPRDGRAYYILPRKPTRKEQLEMHEIALNHLTSRLPLKPNTSRVIDFAYLGPVGTDGKQSSALLAYYDSGENIFHGKGCSPTSCVGYPSESESKKHDIPPSTIDPLEYMCNDVKSWNRKVKRGWANVIVSEYDPILDWFERQYGMVPTEETYTEGLNKRPMRTRQRRYPSNSRTSNAEIQVSSSHHGRSRSQRYHDERPSSMDDQPLNEQEVALGFILVRQRDDTRDREIHTRKGTRHHEHSEPSPLCRGYLTDAERRTQASVPLTGDNVKILNARCHPGDGYNFEEGLYSALMEHYLKELGPKLAEVRSRPGAPGSTAPWSTILSFEDSQAGYLAKGLGNMTGLLHGRLSKYFERVEYPEAEVVVSERSSICSPSESPSGPRIRRQSSVDDTDGWRPPHRRETTSTAITRQSTLSRAESGDTIMSELEDETPKPRDGPSAFHLRSLRNEMREMFESQFGLPDVSKSPTLDG